MVYITVYLVFEINDYHLKPDKMEALSTYCSFKLN